ncbi:MAG: symmetrical bis(5'-nucleosyl)-tetraphosphatase [Pseudomonadota bacterium]
MALYAIGDLQGCYDPFATLLERIDFDPANDRLWLTGDLVNRGKQSLKTLRTVYKLRKRIKVVLGNHDLALLRLWKVGPSSRANSELREVLRAPDADELLNWLIDQPLIHRSKKYNAVLVHAGIPPGWSVDYACARGREVKKVLTGNRASAFLRDMYGELPAQWSPRLGGHDRLRFIVNAFTRMRMLDADGSLQFAYKGPPAAAEADLTPWFDVHKRAARSTRIVFGHWAALGYMRRKNLISLDTGCVWGRHLTALRIDKAKTRPISIECQCC